MGSNVLKLRSVLEIADRVSWKWRGAPVTVTDFGDPAGGADDYFLCIYESVGGQDDPQREFSPSFQAKGP